MKKFALPAVAGLALSTSALAEVPAGVTTALEGALGDVAVVGGAVFLIVIAVAVWKYLKRAT